MKKQGKFIILSFVVMCMCNGLFITNAFAQSEQNLPTSNNGENIAVPYSEETGYIYKYFDGVKYKRLWSYTYGRWIDDCWTKA